MLAKLDPAAARAAALPARRADQGRRARARARGRAAGRRQAREPGPLLRRRARRPRVPAPPRRPAAAQPGRDRRRARGACSAATTASTSSRSASGAGSASAPPSRCTCSPRTPHTNRVTVGPRAALARRGAPRGRAPAPPGRRVSRCAALPRPRRCPAARRQRRRTASSWSWPSPPHAVAPGQLACLMRDDWSWARARSPERIQPERIDLDAPLARDFQAVVRLIVGGIAERVDFAFEEIDDLQLAVERLLAEAGHGRHRQPRVRGRRRAAYARASARCSEATSPRRCRDGEPVPGELTLRRILETVVDSFGVEDVGDGGIVVRLEKRKGRS